jgi:hypothetical protein
MNSLESRSMRLAGRVACMAKRCTHRILVRKRKGKRPLGRLGGRWDDNIKIDFEEIGYDSKVWIGLT